MTNPLTVETLINWMWEFEYQFSSEADHSVFRNRFSRQIARLSEDADRADSLAADLAAAVVRADRAEAQRDKWRQIASDAEKDADEAEDELYRLRTAEPRSLTPDDEMARRFIRAGIGHHWFAADDLDNAGELATVRELLTAALTEPPARPEGAEEIEALVDEYHKAGELILTGKRNGAPLADFLAERGVRASHE